MTLKPLPLARAVVPVVFTGVFGVAFAAACLPAHAAAPAPASAAAAPAEDRADLERTRILGQRELPKLLTIVPWKKPLAGPAATRPRVSVLDEALAPVDRDVLRRELGYHAQLRARAARAARAAAPADTAAAER